MIENDKKIRKGLPPRRDETAYQVLQDIVIPAGTVLRRRADGKYSCDVGMASVGAHALGTFSVDVQHGSEGVTGVLKRVISA